MHQAWGAGRSVVSTEDKKEVRVTHLSLIINNVLTISQLKRARKEGRLAEALLDRRAKLKRRVLIHYKCLSSDFTTVIDSVEILSRHYLSFWTRVFSSVFLIQARGAFRVTVCRNIASTKSQTQSD